VVTLYQRYQQVTADLEGHREALNDPELRELAELEIPELSAERERLEAALNVALLPKDPDDLSDTVLEIRAGAGGEEAALWAADLFRMYSRYAETKGWKIDVISKSEASAGGLKEVVASVSGDRVYSVMRFEGGVHRVQRVPATESQGRIHTSTVTVAVMPEAEEVRADVERLVPTTRLPWFELLLARMGASPLQERQALLRSARRVLGPPGQPIDRLLWLAMRRQFGELPGPTPDGAALMPRMDVGGMLGQGASLQAVQQAMALQQAMQKPTQPNVKLSPGEQMFSPDGRPLFGVPAAPDKPPAPSDLARLLAEMQQLPPGSPARKLYEQQIAKITSHQPATQVSVNTGQKGFDNTLKLRGDFRSGDAVSILDGAGQEVARGLARLSATDLLMSMTPLQSGPTAILSM